MFHIGHHWVTPFPNNVRNVDCLGTDLLYTLCCCYQCPEQCSYNGISRWIQAFCLIILPCLVQWIKNNPHCCVMCMELVCCLTLWRRTTCIYVALWRSLTLRRLMSYIYMEHPFLMFLDHTQRRSTVGRTPLDE